MLQQSARIDAQTKSEDSEVGRLQQELAGIRRWEGARADEERRRKVNSVAEQICVVVAVNDVFFSGLFCAINLPEKRRWIGRMW